MSWWRGLAGRSPGEKNRIAAALVGLCLAIYLPAFYWRASTDLRLAEDTLSRRADRIRRRTPETLAAPAPVALLDRELARLAAEQEDLARQLAQHRGRFDEITPEGLQSMLLEVSSAAESAGVTVDRLSSVEPPDRAPSVGRRTAAMQAHGSFAAMQMLMRSFGRLSRGVTVVRFSMEAAMPRAGDAQGGAVAVREGDVRVDLVLAL